MKNVINKISTICFIVFDTFVDFLFCIRLLYELRYEKFNEYKIKNIKVFLQFTAKSFDSSVFEYYCLQNEDYLWAFYETLKKKNNTYFQFLVLLYSFLINHLTYPIAYTIFGYGIDKYFIKLNRKLDKKIQKNFGYSYLREYKIYLKDNKEYYNKIRFKVFFKETLLNLCIGWNNIIKNNQQSKFFINTDTLLFDIERYF